jgi:GT2 family glycosyltransferase
MQGANMAIRRSAWWAIRGNVCRIGGMHEDFDLSVHAHDQGFRLRFDDTLTVSLGGRQTESSFLRYTEYILLSPKTYASHGMTIQLYMYPVCLLGILCYLPFKILHRGYDREAKRFSIASLFGPGQSRPNPATYVDY